MENKEKKSTGDKIGDTMFVLIIFIMLWEGIKWFHNKFGIIGDMILIAIFIYIAFLQPEFKPKGNPDRTDIHLIK